MLPSFSSAFFKKGFHSLWWIRAVYHPIFFHLKTCNEILNVSFDSSFVCIQVGIKEWIIYSVLIKICFHFVIYYKIFIHVAGTWLINLIHLKVSQTVNTARFKTVLSSWYQNSSKNKSPFISKVTGCSSASILTKFLGDFLEIYQFFRNFHFSEQHCVAPSGLTFLLRLADVTLIFEEVSLILKSICRGWY